METAVALPLDQIICGDNVETMRTFPDACIDLVVTSPPYDKLRTYAAGKPIEKLWDFEGVAQQLWRIVKPGGVVVWVVADATIDGSETGTSFRQALRFMEIGFRLHDTMIYQRTIAPLTHNRYEQEWEFMFVLSKGKPVAWNPIRVEYTEGSQSRLRYPVTGSMLRKMDGSKDVRTMQGINSLGRIAPNVWRFTAGSKGTDDAFAYEHPATFPEALARDHILSWSNEGDIVLDPFSGSGTTAKMSKHNGRHYIGIEINPDYCEIAASRLAQGVLF